MTRAIFFISRRYNIGIYFTVIRGASLKQGIARFLLLGNVFLAPVVHAIGLGEPGQEPVLGQVLDLRIPLLGGAKELPDASCFRVAKPRTAGDFPWVREAELRVVPGAAPYLRVRAQVVRDPLFQVAIDLGCGHDLYREYTLFANPAVVETAVPEAVAPTTPAPAMKKRDRRDGARTASRAGAASVRTRNRTENAEQQLAQRPVQQPVRQNPPGNALFAQAQAGDRLFLSSSDDGGETSLRLSMVLGEHMLRESAFTQEQRETLRLEYQMLAALHERATDQLAVAEKLRSMEGALNDLQGRAAGLQERAAAVDASPATSTAPPATPAPPVRLPPEEESGDWAWYGLLLALVLLLAGGLYWRQRREQDVREQELLPGEAAVDAPRQAELSIPERSFAKQVDVHLEPTAGAQALAVDFELDGGASVVPPVASTPPKAPPGRPGDSIFSINATSVDEHFEANPVMELADIMLSFGRVKGAAQALQEYIDNNPQEALQPWVRLLEVYRMADMREEFNVVASNLNRNFNVEIQPWEAASAEHGDSVVEQTARAGSIEDMPRIVAGLTKHWSSPEVLDYMQQLLRDNRAGQRLGFPLPVVEEILFLIELKETALNMERELAEA